MGTLLQFKILYNEAFDGCRPGYLVILLKGYAVFCAMLMAMALYASLYRVSTGFDF